MWNEIALAGACLLLNWIVLWLWKPWTEAYAGEKGKNLARREDLASILAEVRAVTVAQKEIETKISSGIWDRQTQWQQKREIIANLLGTLFEIEAHLIRAHRLVRLPTWREDVEGLSITQTALAKDLRKWYALGQIFLSKETLSAVKSFFEDDWAEAPGDPASPTERIDLRLRRIEQVQRTLTAAAAVELGLRS